MGKCKINDAKQEFVIPPQIKQKLILTVVTCVGDCYWSLL